jgi:Ca2+-binding EF-hand superfamily protein
MVDKHEFLVGASDFEKLTTKENIKKAFSLFDKDGDGNIDINEFKYVFPEDDRKTKEDQSSEYRWMYLMEEYDTDGDG